MTASATAAQNPSTSAAVESRRSDTRTLPWVRAPIAARTWLGSRVEAVEPTGVGDAYRAGFLAALTWGLGPERGAQVGSVLAAYVVETVGPQDYTFTAEEFLARLDASYGGEAAASVRPHLHVVP